MSELLPCPFCHSTKPRVCSLITISMEQHAVYCSCGIRTIDFTTELAAERNWNTRAQPDDVTIAAMRGAYDVVLAVSDDPKKAMRAAIRAMNGEAQ